MKKSIVSILLLLLMGISNAQRISVEEYIDTYKGAAIAQMQRLGVPASIILAQGILETEFGNSDLVKRSNNHFGIKCKSSWTGLSVSHTDDAPNECFRKYATAEESYRDHSDYLYTSARYASLFKLDQTDYKGWAYGLKRAGYATNPRYPQILISNIEKYNLQQYNYMTLADAGATPERNIETKEEIAKTVDENEVQKETNVFKRLFANKKDHSNQYFNKLKAVMAFKGTSLLAIATQNDLALAKLMEYNDLDKDGLLKEDQWIYLEKKHKEGNRDTYTALQKESLYEISQNNGVQLHLLAAYNQMSENAVVQKGKLIALRPGVALNASSATAEKIHAVQPKEGLYSIAKKYNVTVSDIKEWNQLTADDLKMGQQLIIAK